jgi:hypothetical protein
MLTGATSRRSLRLRPAFRSGYLPIAVSLIGSTRRGVWDASFGLTDDHAELEWQTA